MGHIDAAVKHMGHFVAAALMALACVFQLTLSIDSKLCAIKCHIFGGAIKIIPRCKRGIIRQLSLTICRRVGDSHFQGIQEIGEMNVCFAASLEYLTQHRVQ